MATLTKEQQQALAIADANLRLKASAAPAPQQASVAAPSGMQQFANSGPSNTDPNNMASMAARAFMPPQGSAAIDTSPEGQAMKQSAEDAALRYGLPAAGILAGPYAPAAIPALVGLGTDLAQRLAMKQGRQKDYHYGETIAAPVMAAAFPGAGSMVGAPVVRQVENAAINGAQMALAKAAETAIDQKRAITPQELMQAATVGAAGTQFGNAFDTGMSAATTLAKRGGSMMTRAKAFSDELGYVLPPSMFHPTPVTNVLESIAGKADTINQAVRINEKATTNAVREHFGLERQDIAGAIPELTPATQNTLKLRADIPFKNISNASPDAAAALEQFQKAKDVQRGLERTLNSAGGYSTTLVKEINDAKIEADGWLGLLEQELKTLGKSSLIGDKTKAAVWPPVTLWDARVANAQLALVKDATNLGTGAVDGSWIGRALENGAKLTGPLEKIGVVHQAFSRAIKDAASTPTVAVSALRGAMGLGGAGYALASGQPAVAAATAAATFAAPWASRNTVLSPNFQRFVGASGIPMPQPRADAFSQFMGADARLLGNKIPPINLDQFQNAPGQ